MTVKVATLEDIPSFMEFSKAYHAAGPESHTPFPQSVYEEYLSELINDKDSIIYHAERGVIGCTIEAQNKPYAAPRVVKIRFIICDNGNGKQLIEAAKQFGISRDVDDMTIGGVSTDGKPNLAQARLYRGYGFKVNEETFIKLKDFNNG